MDNPGAVFDDWDEQVYQSCFILLVVPPLQKSLAELTDFETSEHAPSAMSLMRKTLNFPTRSRSEHSRILHALQIRMTDFVVLGVLGIFTCSSKTHILTSRSNTSGCKLVF